MGVRATNDAHEVVAPELAAVNERLGVPVHPEWPGVGAP
jgi:hypothetical protein